MTKQMLLKRREELLEDVQRYAKNQSEGFLSNYPNIKYISFENEWVVIKEDSTKIPVRVAHIQEDSVNSKGYYVIRTSADLVPDAAKKSVNAACDFADKVLSFCKGNMNMYPQDLLVKNPVANLFAKVLTEN